MKEYLRFLDITTESLIMKMKKKSFERYSSDESDSEDGGKSNQISLSDEEERRDTILSQS